MRAMGFGCLLSVLLLAGCGGDDGGMPPVSVDPGDDGGTNSRCIDEDGDGAGRRCARLDCDDNDPDVTNECTLCTRPALDCPCDEGTEPMACRPRELGQQVEMNGQLLQCFEGTRYCHEVAGVEDTWVWTDCNAIFTPL
jgi:hypothetical protein